MHSNWQKEVGSAKKKMDIRTHKKTEQARSDFRANPEDYGIYTCVS